MAEAVAADYSGTNSGRDSRRQSVSSDDSGPSERTNETSDEDEVDEGDARELVVFPRDRGGDAATGPLRLLLVSSRIKNGAVIQSAVLPNVIYLPFRYESTTLGACLGLIRNCLSGNKVETIAMVLHSSHSFVYLTGQDEMALNRNSLVENEPVKDFFTSLINGCTTCGRSSRLDLLACSSISTDAAEVIAKDLTSCTGVSVSISKDIMGGDLSSSSYANASSTKPQYVGDLYFCSNKIRTWSGHIQTLAGFEKIRTVGKGAYGTAVLYRKKDDDSLVILKEINLHNLNVSERQLAQNEVRVLSMLDHPNIIGYYDSFEEDGTLMIEMEYADGGTLAQFLAQQEKPLEEEEILSIFSQIVLAIKYIHQYNVLHRDLKTDNIFLTKDGVVKVGDFGISKLMSSSNGGANTVLGTPYYISPEMCEGKPYNDKSDVWALGCILYEMACLQRTFDGSNLPALVNKIMKGQFAPIKGKYSQELKKLMMDMLQREPESRPSVAELWSSRLPQLMSLHDKPVANNEEADVEASFRRHRTQKLRSVLFYFQMASLHLTPVKLPWKLKICEVAVGSNHVVVVSLEHTVYAWGDGSKGQLGLGNLDSVSNPVAVESLKGKSVVRACCGDSFSVFASDNGIVMTCGDGLQGCLGHGDHGSVTKPRLIETLLSVNVVSIAAGPCHVVAVGSDGEVFVWGNGANGRLGLGNEQSYCQPMSVPLEEKVSIRKCWCGIDGTMLLTDGRSVLACGNNEHNKLGLDQRQGFLMAMKNMFNKCEVAEVKQFTVVKALARCRVVDVSLGPRHSCVIVEPGHVFTFGCNSDGQLGTGNTRPQTVPTEVKYFRQNPALRVLCGDHNTMAVVADHSLTIWGLRPKSQSADSPKTSPGTGAALGSTGSSGYHSRQPSSTSINSSTENIRRAAKDTGDLKNKEPSWSVDALSSPGNNLSFTPLHQLLDHSIVSKSSKEKENLSESSDIIASPLPLLRLASSGAEGPNSAESHSLVVTLTNIFRHGNNLFIQVETTAPPPKRHPRKKRHLSRKRDTGTIISAREHSLSVSSHDGGDEYSSETSELEKSKVLPTWLKRELLDAEESEKKSAKAAAAAAAEDDGSDRSNDDDPSLAMSIRINRDLCHETVRTLESTKALSTDNDKVFEENIPVKVSVHHQKHRTIDQVSSSSSSFEAIGAKDRQETGKQGSKSYVANRNLLVLLNRPPAPHSRKTKPSHYVKPRLLPPSNDPRKQRRASEASDDTEKETKQRQGSLHQLQDELEQLRADKRKTEEKLWLMEQQQLEQRNLLLMETETKSSQRELVLKNEIKGLRLELQRQSSQLKDQSTVVVSLQEQLNRIQLEQQGLTSRGPTTRSHSGRDSRVCSVQ